MNSDAIVYLNGSYLPAGEAKVSVMDRGFIFGDGVYEVIPVYAGRLFRLGHHLERLDHSLQGIRMVNPLGHNQWRDILQTLVTNNGAGDQSLYLQVTRGVSAREHAFPAEVTPTVFAMSSPTEEAPPALRQGVSAITIEDFRWKLCNIKAITLLPNILMRQAATEQGAAEAIMLRDGEVTEGAAANIFIVRGGTVITPPLSNLLLPGITRDLVVELCHAHGIPCQEAPISEAELRNADEIWLTSSTREIAPVITLDGVIVGSGRPGPMWENVFTLYQSHKQALRSGQAR